MKNEIKYINLNGVRQTYIIMYVENDIKYIFNRSVKWENLISFKKLQPIINLLGESAIMQFIHRLEKMYDDINVLTASFILDTNKFYILEIHSEWENINRTDQKNIELRKDELCKKYGAVKRSNNIPNEKLDLNIANAIKKELKKWLIDIYDEISRYAKVINEEIVRTALGQTIENLKNEKQRLIEQISKNEELISKQYIEIKDNKRTLARQNYVIDRNYHNYIFTQQEKEYIMNNEH